MCVAGNDCIVFLYGIMTMILLAGYYVINNDCTFYLMACVATLMYGYGVMCKRGFFFWLMAIINVYFYLLVLLLLSAIVAYWLAINGRLAWRPWLLCVALLMCGVAV